MSIMYDPYPHDHTYGVTSGILARGRLALIPFVNTNYNAERRRLYFIRETGEPGLNVGALLRREHTGLQGGNVAGLDSVVTKVTMRVNLEGYPIHAKQRYASRLSDHRLVCKTEAELAAEAARVVKSFYEDAAAKRDDRNPMHFGPGGLTLNDIYLISLEPVGKRIFDCILAYYLPVSPNWPASKGLSSSGIHDTSLPQEAITTAPQHATSSTVTGDENPTRRADNLTPFSLDVARVVDATRASPGAPGTGPIDDPHRGSTSAGASVAPINPVASPAAASSTHATDDLQSTFEALATLAQGEQSSSSDTFSGRAPRASWEDSWITSSLDFSQSFGSQLEPWSTGMWGGLERSFDRSLQDNMWAADNEGNDLWSSLS